MAKLVKADEQRASSVIERGTIVRLRKSDTIGIVYRRELINDKELQKHNTLVYMYHVLWFDAINSYSCYDEGQIERVAGEITIKN